MISLQHISKTFATPEGELRAVDNVSLEIQAGEVFGIVGFSGAGKSTLLRAINLLERPDIDAKTRVIVGGNDLLALTPAGLRHARRSIGMIFQHFNLLNNRTVAENVALPLEIAGLGKAEREARARECLEILQLSDKARAYPAKLSGGQKQRVAIARALANHPQVLLCDEPTSSVDPEMTRTILAFLKHINERFGITIVLVTHEMEAVNAICGRVAVMERGRVVEQFTLNDGSHVPISGIARHLLRDRIAGRTVLDDYVTKI